MRHTSLGTHMHLFRSFSWLFQVCLDTSGAQASGAHVYKEIHKSSHLSPSPTSPPAEAQGKSRYVCVSVRASVGLPAWSSTSIRVLGLCVHTHAHAHTHTHTHTGSLVSPSFHSFRTRTHTLMRAHTLANAP
jgi:hypothetical protein